MTLTVNYPGLAFHGKPCAIIRDQFVDATGMVLQLVEVEGYGQFWLPKLALKEAHETKRNAAASRRADCG